MDYVDMLGHWFDLKPCKMAGGVEDKETDPQQVIKGNVKAESASRPMDQSAAGILRFSPYVGDNGHGDSDAM